MKKVFSLLAMAAIVLSVGLSSCAKEDTADSLNVDLNRTATIKGTILLNADVTKPAADQKYSSPENVTIFARVDYHYLNSAVTVGKSYYTIPADKIVYNKATGEFTIEAPVGAAGTTNVEFKYFDFPGTLKRKVGADDKTVDVIWKWNETTDYRTVGVVQNEVSYATFILDGADANEDDDYEVVKKDGSNVN